MRFAMRVIAVSDAVCSAPHGAPAIARLLLAERATLPPVESDDLSIELRMLSDQHDSLLQGRMHPMNQLHTQMLQWVYRQSVKHLRGWSPV
jgi:hypothetical protein